jgi:hypothetical protein
MRALLLLLPILSIVACKHSDSDSDADDDGDGVPNYDDCSPNNPDIVAPRPWYPDADADTYGSAQGVVVECEQPAGYVDNADDCEDGDDAVHPGATERCNGLDDDCDTQVDDDAVDQITWYVDGDRDTFGSGELTVTGCTAPNGYVDNPWDCNDGDATVFPGASEVCNAIDDDCDGSIDEDVTDAATWYPDADADGYPDASTPVVACTPPAGYIAENPQGFDCNDTDPAYHPYAAETDCNDPNDYNCDGSVGYVDGDGDGFAACLECNDSSAAINPGAQEICNFIDDDCDLDVDDADASVDLSTGTVFYADVDGDAHGNAANTVMACSVPVGFVDVADDCDDADGNDFPGNLEVCDLQDNDCDALVDDLDDSLDLSTAPFWYRDVDADGFGDAGDAIQACAQPAGRVADALDCDDLVATINPAGTEICGAADEDCDGLVDESDPTLDSATLVSFYADADGDGYGDPATLSLSCTAPFGTVADATDCDDTDPAYNPGALETDCADPNDYNCDGATGYADTDGDGFAACAECDDGNPNVHPGALEICNTIDDDCDGLLDDLDPDVDRTTGTFFYPDADTDGWGDATNAIQSCAQPPFTVLLSGDCDDLDVLDFPGNVEVCDGQDNNCDTLVDDADPLVDVTGAPVWFVDVDADGFGDALSALQACAAPLGRIADGTDCVDTDAADFPGNVEVCDSGDNDCDRLVDDADTDLDLSTASVFYRDGDADGFGDPATTRTTCLQPSGYVIDATDCDDAVALTNPNGVELCNTVDDDCDGLVDDADPTVLASDLTTFYLDNDTDTYGQTDSTVDACVLPAGYAAASGDCNDADTAYHPSASETDCTDPNDYNCDGFVGFADNDGDGFAACIECDDDNPAINPSAAEICDPADADEDCNGLADDADTAALGKTTTYADADRDGFGDVNDPGSDACDPASGRVEGTPTDCDDGRANVNPGEIEICDDANLDEDCSGAADDADANATGKLTVYTDGDGDLHGAGAAILACDPASGTVASSDDCNDLRADVFPGATEVCDAANTDEDCDTKADDADPSAVGQQTWYSDADNDTFGAAPSAFVCDPASGMVSNSTDCDDTKSAVHPGATEICNSIDDDCDALIDDADGGVTGRPTWYADSDSDGYGNLSVTQLKCVKPSGYVADNTDCNDAITGINPGATEVCDPSNVDEDCDAKADDLDPSATGKSTWYRDADGDTYGLLASTSLACDKPTGYVANSTDCNDGAAAINPGATEICDVANTDEDCDTKIDDADPSATGKLAYVPDVDNDTYGSSTAPTQQWCDPAAGLVADRTDCNDDNAAVHPLATEVCNGFDDDCDALIDDADSGVTGQATWYADADADGYGNLASTLVKCSKPTGYVANSTDCNDAAIGINPGAQEVCDASNVDEDCDAKADDLDPSATGQTSWFRDADNDTYGLLTNTQSKCDKPAGYVANSTDCNDAAVAINPGATEVCDASNVDEDCDALADDADSSATGKTSWYHDVDGDTFGAGAATLRCDATGNLVASSTDCNDGAAAIHPGATEICNTVDDDCDTLIDDADSPVTGGTTWYADSDGDTYGNVASTQVKCAKPTGYVANSTDCNDGAAGINPGAQEVCDASNVDEDCDTKADDLDPSATGQTTWYRDADADTFGLLTSTSSTCDKPTGYVANSTDCNDSAAAIHPGAQEVCDAADTDEDCDTKVDDADPSATGKTSFHPDSDDDGYGDQDTTVLRCDPLSGQIVDGTDCNDGDNAVNPAATEVCNGYDDDCDGLVDDADGSLNDPGNLSTFYADSDSDGFGDAGNTVDACAQPSGYTDDDTDCNDADGGINPGAQEVCDPDYVDEDCDELSDDDDSSATGQPYWYPDNDADGFGSDPGGEYTPQFLCHGEGAPNADDCDDFDFYVNPDAQEVCSGGKITVSQVTSYRAQTEELVSDAFFGCGCQCEIADVTYDGEITSQEQLQLELSCGTVDEDCDTLVDDADPSVDPSTQTDWYVDADSDSYGDVDDTSPQHLCESPSGTTDDDTDCLDSDSGVNPGASEIPDDGIDQNCDGIDSTDGDGDGYGSTGSGGTDCDDSDPNVNPGALQSPCSGIDDDCDGSVPPVVTVPADYATIQKAIDATTGGYAICVDPGKYVENLYVDHQLWIGASTGVLGDVTIDAGGAGRGVYAYFATLALADVTITGGDATYGAGIYAYASYLSLDDVFVVGNTSSAQGSDATGIGVRSDYSTVVIADSYLEGNYRTTEDGATISGSAYYGTYGTHSFVRTRISSNQVSGGTAYGAVAGYAGNWSFENTLIGGNRSAVTSATGFGLYLSESGSVSLVNSAILDNSSTASESEGGGVWMDTSSQYTTLTIVNTDISDNAKAQVGASVAVYGPVAMTATYSNFGDDDFSGVSSPVGSDGNTSTNAQKYISFTPGDDPASWDLHLQSGSPFEDAGDPTILDKDGSTSDIGVHGGPRAQ